MKKIFLTLFLTSCFPVEYFQNKKNETIYARNLAFSVNNISYTGIANVSGLRSYEIKVSLKKKYDQARFLTCSREEVFDFRSSNFSYTWSPNEIERDGSCFARLEFYSKDAEFYWGVISPSWNVRETLKVTMNCNGGAFNAVGHHMCQTKAGLNQRIIFFVDKIDDYFVGDDCIEDPKLKTRDNRTFDWSAPRWFCTIVFKKGRELFKLTSFGYDKYYIVGE